MDTEPFIAYFTDVWNDSSDDVPVLGRESTASQKKEKERLCSEYQACFEKYQHTFANGTEPRNSDIFFQDLRRFMKEVYEYSDDTLAILLSPELVDASRTFYTRSQWFDAQLKPEEIFQAMRNVWITNGLQLMMGWPVELTPALLAYSLLYPYSDNILDDPAIAPAEKLAFSDRFKGRLQAVGEMAGNHREKKISELVSIIEKQYPRMNFPDVYAGLLAIHHAQTRSLALNDKKQPLSDNDVLSICFDKGGASVLADGILLSGNLSLEVQQFCFGFGIWLQLVDDIQDLAEDMSTGTQTMFAREKRQHVRGSLVQRTFHFGRNIMEQARSFQVARADSFRQSIVQSTELMLIQAIGVNAEYFSPEFVARMERYSPVSFYYLQQTKTKGLPGRRHMLAAWIKNAMDDKSKINSILCPAAASPYHHPLPHLA